MSSHYLKLFFHFISFVCKYKKGQFEDQKVETVLIKLPVSFYLKFIKILYEQGFPKRLQFNYDKVFHEYLWQICANTFGLYLFLFQDETTSSTTQQQQQQQLRDDKHKVRGYNEVLDKLPANKLAKNGNANNSKFYFNSLVYL